MPLPHGHEVRAHLAELRTLGATRIVGALGGAQLDALLEEALTAELAMTPEQVGAVRQHAAADVWHGTELARRPVTAAFATRLRDWFRAHAWSGSGAPCWIPNEATVMRYPTGTGGISPHVDRRRYELLVCIVSLAGVANLRVLADREEANMLVSWRCAPGDMVVLRAPRFDNAEDSRPMHAVGSPLGPTDRISLSLRMDCGRPQEGAPTRS